jgi:hypothetical protein
MRLYMIKKYTISILVLSLAAHTLNSSVIPVYKIREERIQEQCKQLITQSKRAQHVLPMALIAGSGLLGYLYGDGQAKVEKDTNIWKKNLQDLTPDQQRILYNYAHQKAAQEQEQAKEKAEQNLSWFARIKKLPSATADLIIYKIPSTLSYAAMAALGFVAKDRAMLLAKTYAMPLVDKVIDSVSPQVSFDWYKSTKTKFDSHVADIKKYVACYTAPEELEFLRIQMSRIEQALNSFGAEDNLDEQKTALVQQYEMCKARSQELSLLVRNKSGLPKTDIEARIIIELNLLLRDIEKILAFVDYADHKLVYADRKTVQLSSSTHDTMAVDFEASEKLQLRIYNQQIKRAINKHAQLLKSDIEQELTHANKGTDILMFQQQVNRHLTALDEELRSFSDKIDAELQVIW